MWNHKELSKYFTKEEYTRADNTKVKISTQEVGKLRLPSGRISINDPVYMVNTYMNRGFEKTVKPGQYPIILSLADLGTTKQSQTPNIRVAAAMVKFSDNEIEKWNVANLVGEDVSKLQDGQILTYNVDSGTASFIDESFLAPIISKQNKILDMLDESLSANNLFGIVELGGNDPQLIAFRTGYGDGQYGCFWGYDKNNNICALATDFEIPLI
jgi:hypothetical protein